MTLCIGNHDISSYIISMSTPHDKIQYLQKYGINAEWFPAVNGNKLEKDVMGEYISPFYQNFGPKGAIGCAISHMKVWEKAVKNKNKYTAIFEDDVVFYPEFEKYIKKCLDNLPDDFDILYLGASHAYTNYKHVNDYIKIPKTAYCTHAYIISDKGAKKLVSLLKCKVYAHIDVCINDHFSKHKLQNYIVFPELAYQTSTHITSKSNNINANFPIVLKPILSRVYTQPYITLEYYLNIQHYRLGDVHITYYSLYILLLGIILSKFARYDLKILTFIFAILAFPDLIFTEMTNKKWIQILSYYVLFILPSFIGR